MSCNSCNQSPATPTNSATSGQILKAWKDALLSASVDQHLLAIDRQSICTACPHKHKAAPLSPIGVVVKLVPGMASHLLGDYVCTPCGCPVVAKSYVVVGQNGEGGCPLARWPIAQNIDIPTDAQDHDNIE